MIETQRPAGTHIPSVFLALASGLGLAVGLLAAILFGVAGLNDLNDNALTQALGNMSLAWSALLVALLNIPALRYSLPRISGQPAPQGTMQAGWRNASLALVLWAVVVTGAGLLASDLNVLTVILLPPLGLLAAGIPVWWLIELGRRGLHTSPQRLWGTVTASLVATMPVVILAELSGFLIIGILLLAWLASSSPNLISQLQDLVISISNGGASPEALIRTLSPYLEKPGIVLAGLAIFGLIMPLAEELFKTLALWFIPGKRVSEAEGFTLGLVAGGTFALIETLNTLPAMIGQEWAFLILARAATSLLHITCGGLVGWGLASAWQNERYFRLGGLFLLAVIIHGTWNLFVQFSAIQELTTRLPIDISLFSKLAPFVLVTVPLLMLVLLIWINYHLRDQPALEGDRPAEVSALNLNTFEPGAVLYPQIQPGDVEPEPPPFEAQGVHPPSNPPPQ